MVMRLVGTLGQGWHQLPDGLLGTRYPGLACNERDGLGIGSWAPTHVHACAESSRPAHACVEASTDLLPWWEWHPGLCPGCSSSSTLPQPPTHRDSWSPARPARVSCRLSSSPKASCSRRPSQPAAQGSPRCCPQGAPAPLSPRHWTPGPHSAPRHRSHRCCQIHQRQMWRGRLLPGALWGAR